jgi:hypothetical protein
LRRLETFPVCHILLNDPKFFSVLLLIDRDLAQQCQAAGCPCGGALHKANYPRKPRGCPPDARTDCALRFSFCCNRCRKRMTAQSVRFLGRRVYLSLAVVLLCGRRGRPPTAPGKHGEPARQQPRYKWARRCRCRYGPWPAGGTGGFNYFQQPHSGRRVARASCRRSRRQSCRPVCWRALPARRHSPCPCCWRFSVPCRSHDDHVVRCSPLTRRGCQ